MKIKTILSTLLVTIVITSCGGKSESTSADAQPQTETTSTNEALKPILTAYFQLKDALVGDDAAKAKEAASALLAITGEYGNKLNESLNAIAATDDIKAQRTAFETLSMNLYDIAKAGTLGMTVYKQFCPMAFDNKGAFWLSDNKQVMNPYFGSSMLRCGSVKEELK